MLITKPPNAGVCDACGEIEDETVKVFRCSVCQNAFYCTPKCQKKDWKEHKFACSKLTLGEVSDFSLGPEAQEELDKEKERIEGVLDAVVESWKLQEGGGKLTRDQRKTDAVRDFFAFQLPPAFSYTASPPLSSPLRLLFISLWRLLLLHHLSHTLPPSDRPTNFPWTTQLNESSLSPCRLYPPKMAVVPGELSSVEYEWCGKNMAPYAAYGQGGYEKLWLKVMQVWRGVVDLGMEKELSAA